MTEEKRDRKTLKREYQQHPPLMGIYQIRNLANDKILIGASLNLHGILNRNKFQLEMGGHPNKTLQAEWNEFGEKSFVFEILDELAPNPDPQHDHRDDLEALLQLWLDQLQPYGERGYNEKTRDREERLRLIARRRSSS